MALGAVFFSLPMAFLTAFYGVAAQGVSAPQGLLIYATMGTAILLSFTLLHGLRIDDFR